MPSSCLAGRSRRARLSSFVLVGCLFASALAPAQPIDRAADALLAVDQQRPSVVERIVTTWGPALAKSRAPVSVDELRARLMRLRADRLFAASIAGTEEGLREVTGFPAMTAATKPVAYAKALGDAAIDVVYTPVTPCRLVETRGTFAAVYQGNGSASHTPVPFAPNEIRSYTVQGGNDVCLTQLPGGLSPSAVQLQVFGIPTTGASGDIEILPQGATFGSTATMVYVASLNFNTVSTAAKINTSNKQIGVQVRGGGAHLAIDVVGYFAAPSGNGGRFFRQGGNAFGTAAALGTIDNQPLALLANGQPAMTYLPNATSPNIIGGHASNSVDSSLSGQTIAGGGFAGDNCFDSATNTSTRSCLNMTTGNDASIGGGASNMALGDAASVAGGFGNTAAGIAATVAGGGGNTASGNHATVGGGRGNNASGHRATVVGGEDNVADHDSATVLGGRLNQAAAAVSVAAGEAAIAMHTKSFVWDAWNSGSATSFRSNAFQIHGENGLDIEYGTRRADGGGTSWVFIGNAFPGQAIATSTGAFLSTGGTWVPSSDRARKTSVLPIDPAAVLEAVMQVPITSWQYKVEDPSIRHIGPMAQDFYRAFGFGYNDKSIATIDADGVALAAIQGLRKLLLEKDAEIDGQRREIVALKERMVEVDAIREDLAKLRGALADMQRVPASP